VAHNTCQVLVRHDTAMYHTGKTLIWSLNSQMKTNNKETGNKKKLDIDKFNEKNGLGYMGVGNMKIPVILWGFI
jgi:hypothetical protein